MILGPRRQQGLLAPGAAGFFGVPWYKIALALTPDTIVASGSTDGSTVTAVGDATGKHPSATGTSTVLDLSGPVRGVRFDGTTSRLDGTGAGDGTLWSDDGATIFTVMKTLGAPPSGRGTIYETSDTTASDRSSVSMHAFGNTVIDQKQQASAIASYVSDPVVDVVLRHRFGAESRDAFENGKYGGSAVVYGGPARIIKHYRLASRLDGQWRANIVIYYWIVGVGLTLAEAERIDAGLRAIFGIASPYSLGATTDDTGDPRFVVPPTIEAIVGVPVQLLRDGVHYADGIRTQTFTSDLGVDSGPGDRWTVTPAAPGTYAAQLVEASYSTSASIVAVPAISGGATPVNVHVFGDSQIQRAGNAGWLLVLKSRLGSRIVFDGSFGTSPTKHCGLDSTTIAYWDQVVTAGFVDNPWANGGASIDIPSYIAGTLSGVAPDVLICSLQNDASGAAQGSVATVFAAAMVRLESIIARWQAAVPGILIGIMTIYPGATDPAAGWGAASTRLVFREKWHHWCELLQSYWAGREVDNIRLIHTFSRIDCLRSYSSIGTNADAHHFGPSPGHVEIANVVEPWLAHYAY